MPLRSIQLPKDIESIVDLIVHGFQYPENAAWSLQTDQVENMVSVMKSARRLWPLLWIARLVSPHWRDYLSGFLWIADDRPVGVCFLYHEGEVWSIAYLAVLPKYRRRSIARQLARAALDDIRARGGKRVVLEVIAGNLPAYTLFEQLGFAKYSGYTEYIYDSQELPAVCALPEGYAVQSLKPSDWRPQYELEQRITPLEVQQFEPVDPSSYRSQVSIRRVTTLIAKASGIYGERLIVRSTTNGQTAAYGMNIVRRRPGGINTIIMELDPVYGELAAFLVRHLIRTVQQLSPGRRIEFTLPEWQGDLIGAVQELGDVQSVPYHQLGMLL